MTILISANGYAGSYVSEFEARLDASSGGDAHVLASPITSAGLAGASVLLLILPPTPLTADEISAITSFVNDGGRLVLFTENYYFEGSNNENVQALLTALGVDIDPGAELVSQDPVTLTSHAFNDGLAPFTIEGGGTLSVSGDAEVLATAGGYPVGAFQQVGSGEVFVFSDINWFHVSDGDGSASAAYLERVTEYEFVSEPEITDAIIYRMEGSSTAAEDAAASHGLTTAVFTTGSGDAAFAAAVAAADPATTILVIDSPGYTMSQPVVDALIDYISSGGHVVMSYWNLDAHADLQAALQVSVSADMYSPETVQDGAPSDIFDGIGSEIYFEDRASDNGDRLNAVGDAVVEAGFAGGGGAIVVGNDGRTIVNGFLFWDMVADPTQLIANEIGHILGASDANADPVVTGPVTSTQDEDAAAYSVDLLAGASDGDGDTLTVTGLTLVSGYDSGITIDGNELDVDPNAYTYLNVGDSEVITYSYTIEDGNGGSVAQTATITITGVNDAPVVTAAVTSATDEDQAGYSVDLLANSDDEDFGAVLNATNVTLVSGDGSGITVNGNSLDVAPGAYTYLADGDTEVVTYTYDVEDEHGATVTQTATVTITGINDAPTVTAAVISTTDEDQAAYSVDLLANADDVDDGAVLNASGVTWVSGDATGIIIDGNELDVDPSAYNHLAAGESEVVTYSYDVEDEHGATVTQTATVTINGVNDAPTANDDVLGGGSGGGALRVGYYEMSNGAGLASQVEAIEAAGHIAVLITDLSDAELASIDMLLVENTSNSGYGAEYLARLSAINTAVENGLTLIMHDWHVDTAESVLPGSGGFNIVRNVDGPEVSQIDFIEDGHSVASGPGGTLDDASLDGGTLSNHGFAIDGTLPADADLILSTSDSSHIVAFSYSHGSGHVVYTTIPYLYYTSDTVGAGANNMQGMAEEFGTNLIDYAATDLGEQPLADEDTVEIIQTADLLANDTDPDTTDVLAVSAVSATSTLGASVTLNGDGSISYDPLTALNYLAEGETVEDSFTYTVSDGNGGTDEATVTFTVVGINDAPSAPVDIDPTGDGAGNVRAAISEHMAVGSAIGLEADSTDPEGDAFEYFFRDGTGARVQTLGFFAIDALTGVVTLAAEVNYELATSHEITVYASDGSDESSTTFTVDIVNVVEHLFTEQGDGTPTDPIDFNNLPDGAYDYDGAQYTALGGDDYVILPDVAVSVLPGHLWDYNVTFEAGAGNDVVQGGDGNDDISGGEGDDSLFGRDGDDRLVGSAGNDILAGGDGSDKLTGSRGTDIFVFTGSELGTTKLGEHDTITDFTQREDKIDISALYSGGTFGGYKNGALTGRAGDAYKVGYYYESGKTWVEGDTDGDGHADFVIELSGRLKLGKSDFIVADSAISTEFQWDAAVGGLALDYETYHRDEYFL